MLTSPPPSECRLGLGCARQAKLQAKLATDQPTQIGATVGFLVFLILLYFGGIWFLLLLLVVAAGAVGLRIQQLKTAGGGGGGGGGGSGIKKGF